VQDQIKEEKLQKKKEFPKLNEADLQANKKSQYVSPFCLCL